MGYDRVDYHAFAYFGACVVILGLCTLSFLALEAMPITRCVGQSKAKGIIHPHTTMRGRS